MCSISPLRVVLDASLKATDCVSFNDRLVSGPKSVGVDQTAERGSRSKELIYIQERDTDVLKFLWTDDFLKPH